MNRKQFIESHGATCNNWNWSWSFINQKDKIIIFGQWDIYETDKLNLLFRLNWEFNHKGKRNNGFKQSLEHIRLIEEENYTLKTFKIYHSNDHKDEEGLGPAKISGFDPHLEEKILIKYNNDYFTSSKYGVSNIAEEVNNPEVYIEGSSKIISVNTYERNPLAREKCINYYGCKCQVCNFDFEKVYGNLGKGYIHVHHLKPLSEIKEEYQVDPIKDLIPVCANCHSIIHRKKIAIDIDTLKTNIKR